MKVNYLFEFHGHQISGKFRGKFHQNFNKNPHLKIDQNFNLSNQQFQNYLKQKIL